MQRRTFLKLTFWFSAGIVWGKVWALRYPVPGPKDRCPVCGMYVIRHRKHLAGLQFKDGKTVFFCSTKCFFHAYHHWKDYFPGRKKGQIAHMWVTEYYRVKPIPAKEAFYLVGCDLIGPMGYMIVPVQDLKAAQVLKKDHHCSRILSFEEVTPEIVEATRKGKRIR